MSKQADKSKAKTKKHINVKTKNKIIIGVVVTAMVLLVLGYFAYFTGFPAKVLTGARIIHTVDGKEKTVERVSIDEMNYYYSQTYSQYVNYGLISSEADLKEVYNPTTGQTYGQMLWENAANSAQTQYMLYDAAMKSGFKPVAADRYAEEQVDNLRTNVDYMNQLRDSNMTADQYLQNLYGKGMTVQIFRKIMQRNAVVEEFKTYLQQTTFVPDQATLQAKFDEDPSLYTLCRFQVYYVAAETLPEGATEEEKTKAAEDALKKAHEICDGCVNAVEFQTRVMQNCDDSYRDRMMNGEDPTSKSGYTKDQLKSFSEEFAEFCYNPDTAPNSSMAFIDKENSGAYAMLFEETYIDDEPTAAYRVIVLTDDVLSDISKTLEQKAPSHQKLHAKADEYVASVTTEDQFIELAKKYSTETESLLTGGYVSGVKQSDFKGVVTEEGADPVLADEDQKLIDWLYDPARKPGDMYIIDCVASVSIYYYCDVVPAWMDTLRNNLVSENFTAWYSGTISDETYSTVVNHGLIDFFS